MGKNLLPNQPADQQKHFSVQIDQLPAFQWKDMFSAWLVLRNPYQDTWEGIFFTSLQIQVQQVFCFYHTVALGYQNWRKLKGSNKKQKGVFGALYWMMFLFQYDLNVCILLMSALVDFAVSNFLPYCVHGPKLKHFFHVVHGTHSQQDLNLLHRPQRHRRQKMHLHHWTDISAPITAINSTAANATTAEKTSHSPQHLEAELMERQGPLFVAEKAEILHLFRFSGVEFLEVPTKWSKNWEWECAKFWWVPKTVVKRGYFEDLHTPALQARTLPLEGPRILRTVNLSLLNVSLCWGKKRSTVCLENYVFCNLA